MNIYYYLTITLIFIGIFIAVLYYLNKKNKVSKLIGFLFTLIFVIILNIRKIFLISGYNNIANAYTILLVILCLGTLFFNFKKRGELKK